MEITFQKREFTFGKGSALVRLPDPNPEFTIQECLDFYSGQYPELTTATLEDPVMEGKKAVYKVNTTVGTKG